MLIIKAYRKAYVKRNNMPHQLFSMSRKNPQNQYVLQNSL